MAHLSNRRTDRSRSRLHNVAFAQIPTGSHRGWLLMTEQRGCLYARTRRNMLGRTGHVDTTAGEIGKHLAERGRTSTPADQYQSPGRHWSKSAEGIQTVKQSTDHSFNRSARHLLWGDV